MIVRVGLGSFGRPVTEKKHRQGSEAEVSGGGPSVAKTAEGDGKGQMCPTADGEKREKLGTEMQVSRLIAGGEGEKDWKKIV